MSTVKIARQGVFFTIQGEGHLLGQPMVFVRMAGCTVGCPGCDTDYSFFERVAEIELADRVMDAFPPSVRDRWVWITGGEPSDQPGLNDVVREIKDKGVAVAVATSGIRRVVAPVDWLSVSPHSDRLVQRYGNEIKLVPGLNGLDAERWIEENDDSIDFWLRFLQPLDGEPDSVKECLRIHERFPHWGLTMQTHKMWGLP